MSKAEVVRKYGVEEPRLIQYDSYETMVSSIKEELNTTEKLLLRVRWFVGCQAYILMENRKYGIAAAAALVLFLFIFVFTMVQLLLQKKTKRR